MMEEIRSTRSKFTGRSRLHSIQNGNNFNVDNRQNARRLKNFFESLNDSSVVKKGHHMHKVANQSKPMKVGMTTALQKIANEILDYIPTDKHDSINLLVKYLVIKIPTTLDQLEIYSENANKLYELIDFKLIDKSEDAENYRDRIVQWRSEFQKELYDLRDELILKEEDGLMHFGLEKQFHKLHPHAQIPAFLTERQRQLGVILFDLNNVENDCGKFARRLNQELVVASMESLLDEIERNGMEGEMLRHAFRDALSKAPRKDILNYKKSEAFPCGYHTKASIGSHAGKIYSLEAHKGKPFMLAPELREFNSLDEYLEMDDQYVESRSTSGLASDFANYNLDSADISTIKDWIKIYAMGKPNNYLGRKGF